MANNAQVQFAGGVLRVPRHACAFIETRAQGYELTLPFIKDGFDLGDRAVHLVDSEFREDHLERLRSVGIDVEAAEESGRLELLNWNDTYVRNGRFDQDWMFSFIEQGINAAANIGARTRLIADMEWATDDTLGVEDVVEYESRINYIWSKVDDIAICKFEVGKFRGSTIVQVMRAHPMVVIGGRLQENPFYVPPDDFLREIRSRR